MFQQQAWIPEDLKEKDRLIVFVIGGISYSEIRAIRALEKENNLQTEIIIGSTMVMKPSDYIEGLR